MPAPSTSSYVLQSLNSELSNARSLAIPSNNSQFSLSLGGGVLNLVPANQLGGLHTLSTAGWFAWDGLSSFVGRSITSNGTVEVTHPEAMNANTNVEFADNSTYQRVNVYSNGTLIGDKTNLNWIRGRHLSLNITDNDISDRTDLTLSSSGSEEGGTVTEITFASSYFTLGGTNPITNTGVTTIDLPVGTGDDIGNFLTLSSVDPNVLAWDPLSSSGTIDSITFASSNNSLGNPWFTITNPVITASGTATIDLNEWSSLKASSSVDMGDDALTDALCWKFSSSASQTRDTELQGHLSYPQVLSSALIGGDYDKSYYLGAKLDGPIATYIVGVSAGYPAMPAGTQTYGSTGSILVGNGGTFTNAPSFSVLASPTGTQDQVFYLKCSVPGGTVYWDTVSQVISDTVSLNYTAVSPTGSGDPIVLGDGTCFVPNNRIRENSIIHVQPVGTYNGLRPSIGPVSVRINANTSEGQLPVGFIIYGNSHHDNGKQVSYTVVSY